MNEHSYIRSIHRQLPAEVYRWKINDRFAGGVPDAWYCGAKRSLYTEYKYVPRLPKRTNTIVSAALSELQRDWIKARAACGVDTLVVLGIEKAGMLFLDADEAVEGVTRSTFEQYALQTKDIAAVIAQYTLEGRPIPNGYRKKNKPQHIGPRRRQRRQRYSQSTKW